MRIFMVRQVATRMQSNETVEEGRSVGLPIWIQMP